MARGGKTLERPSKRLPHNEKDANVVWWCRSCLVPVLNPICPSCHEEADYFARDLKPVFSQERDLYEDSFQVDLPDEKFLFRNYNRIFAGNSLLLRFKLGYDPDAEGSRRFFLETRESTSEIESRISLFEDTICASYASGSDYLKRVLKTNKGPMRQNVNEAVSFIRDVRNRERHEKSFISFSGGKDSIVTSMLVAEAGLQETPLFFADTTLEFDETYTFIREFSRKYGFELIDYEKYRSPCDFFALCEELGPPSLSYRWCCTVFKSYPPNKFYQEFDGDILTFDGIRRAESRSRSKYSQVSRIKKIPRQIAAYPIFHWKELDVWLYILGGGLREDSQEIAFNPLYLVGNTRVGCYMCPAASPTNCFFRKHFNYDKYQRFERLLYEHSEKVGRDMEWVDLDYWRLRRPKQDKSDACFRHETPLFRDNEPCGSGNQFVYTFKSHAVSDLAARRGQPGNSVDDPFTSCILEFLKPYGVIELLDMEGHQFFEIGVENPLRIFGKVGASSFSVRFSPNDFSKSKRLFERQLQKALNCVACGGCVGVCSRGAISVEKGAFSIDPERCNHCGVCVSSTFVNRGCIALGYRLSLNKIRPKRGNKESTRDDR